MLRNYPDIIGLSKLSRKFQLKLAHEVKDMTYLPEFQIMIS